jgi:hypothetical protein
VAQHLALAAAAVDAAASGYQVPLQVLHAHLAQALVQTSCEMLQLMHCVLLQVLLRHGG